jgi:hypothetical protein
MDTPPPTLRAASNSGDVSPPLPGGCRSLEARLRPTSIYGFRPPYRYLLRSLLTASWLPWRSAMGREGACYVERRRHLVDGSRPAVCASARCRMAFLRRRKSLMFRIWKGYAERFR